MLSALRGKVLALVILMTVSSCAQGMQTLVLPLYLRSIGVRPAILGLIFGTSGLALIIFEFSWGWWSDRVGIGIPLIISRSGVSIVMLGYAFVQPIPGFFLLQFTGAAFSSALGPLSWTYLGHVTDSVHRGAAIALAQIPGPVGMSIGALMGGVLAEAVGYRPVFVIAAVVAASSVVLAVLTFRNVGAYNSSSRAAELLERPKPTTWLVPLAAISTVTMLAWVGAAPEKSFLPILAQTRGLRSSDIGLLLTLLSGLTAVLVIPMARLSARVGRKTVIMCGIGLGTIGLASYSVAGGLASLFAVVCLRALANAATVPIAITALSVATPPRVRGKVMGLYGSLEDVGIAAGPAICGFVWSNWGINAAFVAMAIANAASFIAASALIRERRWSRLRTVPLASTV